MSNNAPDYEDNLVFPPQEIKSQDDVKHQDTRSSDVLLEALAKCEKLEKQLKIAVDALEDIGFCKTSIYQNTPFKLVSWAIDALTQIKELDK